MCLVIEALLWCSGALISSFALPSIPLGPCPVFAPLLRCRCFRKRSQNKTVDGRLPSQTTPEIVHAEAGASTTSSYPAPLRDSSHYIPVDETLGSQEVANDGFSFVERFGSFGLFLTLCARGCFSKLADHQ